MLTVPTIGATTLGASLTKLPNHRQRFKQILWSGAVCTGRNIHFVFVNWQTFLPSHLTYSLYADNFALY